MANWDANLYSSFARFVPENAVGALALLNPLPGETILDMGCGDGLLSRSIAAVGCRVIGIDSSPQMVAAACAQGVDARLADGQDFDLDIKFDAVFSHAAIHWMKDLQRMCISVQRALNPGGRFVGELGAFGTIPEIHTALREGLERRAVDPAEGDPWIFPTDDEFSGYLTRSHFRVDSLRYVLHPTYTADMDTWIRLFAPSFLATCPKAENENYIAEVVNRVRPMVWHETKGWYLHYLCLRFAAFAV